MNYRQKDHNTIEVDCSGCNAVGELHIWATHPADWMMVRFPTGEAEFWCKPCATPLFMDFAFRRKARATRQPGGAPDGK